MKLIPMLKSIKRALEPYFSIGTSSFNFLIFILVLAGSISLRFFHFGEVIDDPHGWRQCDTANYIWDFYKHGVNFFSPSVCWMGGYKTLILEFALPEALAAWLFELVGPSNALARLMFLVFFCVGVYYFYKVCRLFLDLRTSQLATVLYTILPLSYYYSRALHIDYFALSFAFGMFYYYAIGIKAERILHIVLGSFFAAIAFLVKAPYALPFCIPLLYIITKEKKWIFCLRWGILFILPVVLFGWWIKKSTYINSLAPDWFFIPGYRRFDDNTKWYFGAFEHRFIIRSWNTLIERFLNDLGVGIIGISFLLAGIVSSIYKKLHVMLWLWFGGVILYLFIFFNLNVIHNYYQIPFVPVFAIFMALGIIFVSDAVNEKQKRIWTTAALTSLLAIACIYFSEKHFFTEEPEFANVAHQLEKRTTEHDLIIASRNGLSAHCPLILHRANRNGWSIHTNVLTKEMIEKLIGEGCSFIAIVDNSMPTGQLGEFVGKYKMEEVAIEDSDDKHLFLINLKKLR